MQSTIAITLVMSVSRFIDLPLSLSFLQPRDDLGELVSSREVKERSDRQILASNFLRPPGTVWKRKTCFVTIQQMQSFNTKDADAATPDEKVQTLTVCAAGDLRPGACVKVELPAGGELAVYNVAGEYYATENLCPHRGAPLSDGDLRGHIIECGWHGWQFDVRTGECLTVTDQIRTSAVRVEEGIVLVVIES